MSLVGLVLAIAAIGVLMWLVNTKVPMDPFYKTIINVVVAVAVILFLLQLFGVLGVITSIRVGAVR